MVILKNEKELDSKVFNIFLTFIYSFFPVLLQKASYEAEPRSSFIEGARDIAILEAMLESGLKQGAAIEVKRI